MQTSIWGLLLCTLLTVVDGFVPGDMKDGMVRRAEMIPMVDLDNAPSRILLQEEGETGIQAMDLARASRTGQDDEVRALLGAKVDPNLVTSGGTPALWRAAFNNHSSTVEILLDAGADIDARNANGTTALYAAAQNGNSAVVVLLIARGADANIASKWGSSPLLVGSQEGFAKVTQVLLGAGAVLNVSKTESGQGALWSAAFGGHKEVVRVLLKGGAIVDVPDVKGRTPLIAASQNGHADVVQILLEGGADPNKVDMDGNTAFHIAAFYCHSLVTKLLVKHGGNKMMENSNAYAPLHLTCWKEKINTQNYAQQQYQKVVDMIAPLFKAARLGSVPDIERLIESGEDMAETLWDDWTVLHEVARSSQSGAAQILIEKGIDVNAVEKIQQSALHIAAQAGSRALLSILFQSGAKVSHRDVNGRTPLHIAALYGQDSVTDELLQAGINANEVDKAKRTAVHLAVSKGYANVIHALVSSSIDPDLVDKFGNTALHDAAAGGDLEVLRAVMELGPDLDAQNRAGQTPLHIAAKAESVDIVQELLKKGANQTIMDGEGNVPRDVVSSGKRNLSTAEEIVIGLLLENSVSGLLHATREGDRIGVRRWLTFGVDVDYALSNGTTALHVATQTGDVDMLDVILTAGANASIPDEHGWTVLHYAADLGRNNVLRAVAGENVDVLAKGQDGETALHVAPASNLSDSKTMVLLIDLGGNVNSRDGTGRSPLHIAAENSRFKMAKALVEAGGDIDLLDNEGKKPVDLLPSGIDRERRLRFKRLLEGSRGSRPDEKGELQSNSATDTVKTMFQDNGEAPTTVKSGMPMVAIIFMILLPSVFVFVLAGLAVFIYKRSKANGIPSCWEKENTVDTPSTIWTELYNPSELSETSSSLPLRARQALNFAVSRPSSDVVTSPVLFPNPYYGATVDSSSSVGHSFLEDAIDVVPRRQSQSLANASESELLSADSSAGRTQSSVPSVEMPQRSCISFSEQGPRSSSGSPCPERLQCKSAQLFQPRPRTVPFPLHNMRVEVQRRRRQERYPTLYTDARSHFSSYSSRSQLSDSAYYSASSNAGTRRISQESFGSSTLGFPGFERGRIPEGQSVEQFGTLQSLHIPSSSHSIFGVRDIQSEP